MTSTKPAGSADNGWIHFDVHDLGAHRAMTEPHWLLNSETKDVAIARRAVGSNIIQMLDRCDQKVLETDGFDWAKPVGKKPGPLPGERIWRNPLPVVVMLVPTVIGLLLVRRAARDTRGKIALPGGFQEVGETWEEAGCREVYEETGIAISPSRVRNFGVDTVENGTVNLIYGIHDGIVLTSADRFVPQEREIMEVLTTNSPVETAFESHTRMIARHFAGL
ncbi:NUDIX domain-containing protein [Agrobacterium rubi]|nr:NUDIX domain-containing protein [Agrobacterium rubi]NTF24765.1 NUDIX domain-containing protein [Agrobacterium rubi]